MIRISQIKIKYCKEDGYYKAGSLERKRVLKELTHKTAGMLKIPVQSVSEISIVRHSMDARKKPEIYDVYTVDITVSGATAEDEERILKKAHCHQGIVIGRQEKYLFPGNRISDNADNHNRPVIIGAGPAGLFCAYMLASYGYRPILLERGSCVEKRHVDVEKFWETGFLDTASNVQFGEGGAGTFSDGKLNTAVKDKSGRAEEVLRIFNKSGAPDDICYESKPHIGTDILMDVVANMRKEIIASGGEVYFDSRVTDFRIEKRNSAEEVASGKTYRITGVRTEKGTYDTENVVLAIGHSARDTFQKLYEKGVYLEPKAFAVGLRIEHPQKLINLSQYGFDEDSLPPASYKLVYNAEDGHGVYSFCMCPGGYVVNASSEEGCLAVNGMSYHGRNSANANSAIVVTVSPEDFGGQGAMAGVEFQRKLERKAFEIGKGRLPVEYFDDFRNRRDAKDRPDRNRPCIKGGYVFANVHEILPDSLYKLFLQGMKYFGSRIHGFDADETLVDGVESRTSSPLRITRDMQLESVNVEGLYPCGEGAGYAGGIMSAAMDGIKVAETIADRISKQLKKVSS